MNKRKLLLVGGGGHCKSVIDVLEEENVYHAIGIVEQPNKRGTLLLNYPVVGSDDDLEDLFLEGYKEAFITIGSLGDSRKRRMLFEKLLSIGFEIPNIISKTAIVSQHISLGCGNFIGKNVIINVSSKIGNNNILNTGSIIEHDCVIASCVHIAPGATLSGGVRIDDASHIGTNATVIQGVSIGENTIIGAGSVVVTDMPSNVVAYGVPCKERKSK